MTTAPRAAARTSFVSLTVVLATVATSTSALAVGGRPDPSFSDDGRATAFRNGGAAYAVAIDRRGRILVAGYDVGRRDTDLALARFRSNGRLDRRFGGGDGRVTTDLGGTDYGFDVAVGSRGRIVVAGMRERRRGSRMAVAVYGPRGRLDRSFSRNGIAFIGFGRAFQGATSVAIGASGRIVAGGWTSNGETSRWALTRLRQRGARDRAFGGDGRVTADLSAAHEQINDLTIVSGGAIVAVGSAETRLKHRVALARFRIGGSLDRRFGNRGVKRTDVANGADIAYGVVEQAGGRLIVVGHAANGGRSDWSVLRYRRGGRLDDTFHGDGIRIVGFAGGYEVAHAATVQANGRIVVVGRFVRSGDDRFGVVRLKANGHDDLGFSNDGRAIVRFGRGNATGRDVVRQRDGRIVVAGETIAAGRRRFAVARLLPS